MDWVGDHAEDVLHAGRWVEGMDAIPRFDERIVEGLADVEDGSSPAPRSASTAERTEATVADDGTFIAELRVPADAVGDYEVVVSGAGLDGTTKRQTYTYNVDPAANFVSNASASPAEEGNGPTMALAAVLAALILAVGFSWPTLVTRFRR